MPLERARVSPLDRGFVFGDGVYEGLRSVDLRSRGVERPHVVAMDRHVARMDACLREIGIPVGGFDASRLGRMTQELLDATGLRDAFVYWQVTRGAPNVEAGETPRSRVPKKGGGGMTPTVFGMATPQPAIDVFMGEAGLFSKSAVTMPDIRWLKGRIKSVSLLGNVIEAMDADSRGVDDAVLVRDGFVGEGLATNVVLAFSRPGGETELVTPTLESAPILAGVTRGLLLDSSDSGLVERAVRVEELSRASEIMMLGSSTMVASVTMLDGKPVGDGKPGPAARGLLRSLVDIVLREAGATTVSVAPNPPVVRPVHSAR